MTALRDGSLLADWAGEPRIFRLAWGQLIALQDRLGIGPQAIARRLAGDSWRAGDVAEVILWGLAGGGMATGAALAMVRAHVETAPPAASLPLARAIIAAALTWPDEDELPARAGTDRAAGLPDLPEGRVRVAALYGNGAAMGFTPSQVDACGVWQFSAALAGWARAQGGDEAESLSSTEMDALWAGVQQRMN